MKKSWDSHLTDESIVDSAVNAQKKVTSASLMPE